MVALGGLAGTEVDAAIGMSDPAPGIHRLALYEEHSVLVARRGHPRIAERATRRTLAAERYVQVNVAFGMPSRLVEQSFTDLGIRRDIAAVVPNYSAAATVVAATDLLSTIPKTVVDRLGRFVDLRVVASPLRTPPIPMHLSWHERTHTDPAMVLFRELVVRSISGQRTKQNAG